MGLGASSNGPAYQNREYKDLSRGEKLIYNSRSTDDFDRNILLILNAVGCNIYFNLNAREKTAFKDLNENNKIYFLAMSDGLRARYIELEDEGEKAFLLRNYYLDIKTFNRRFVSYQIDVQYRKTSAALDETTNGIRETREENIRAYEDFRRRFNGIEDDVNELRNDVDTLQTDMTDVKNNVRGLTTRTDNLRNNFNTLQTGMTNVQNNVNGLAIVTDNLRNNVNDVQTRTANLEGNFNRVKNTTDKNTEEINNIKVRQEEDRREKEDMKNFLQERFHYGMKKVNELSSSTSSTSSEIPLQEIETEHSEIL